MFRRGQCTCSFDESFPHSGPDGMDDHSQGTLSDLGEIWQTNGRPVCHQVQPQAADFCLSSSGRESIRCGCSESIMERVECVRISAFSSPSSSLGKSKGRESQADSNCTRLAGPNMVSGPPQSSESSTPTSSESRSVSATKVRHSARKRGHAKIDSLAFVRSRLESLGASALTIGFMSRSNRSSTQSVYSSHWKAWVSWCDSEGADPFSPSVIQLANHLSKMASSGSSVASLRVRRSAIHKVLRQMGAQFDYDSNLIEDVIKGVALIQSRNPTRLPRWDLRVVLLFLSSNQFEPLTEVSFFALSQKVLFLTLLASGRRCSEIHGLSGLPLDFGFERDGSISLSFLPEFLAKNQSSGTSSPPVIIKPITRFSSGSPADKLLCPVRALKCYWSRSKGRRSGGHFRRLFIPAKFGRKKDVVKSTLARWIVVLIKAAYSYLDSNPSGPMLPSLVPLSSARVHETRAWAASLAASKSTKLEEILQTCYWRTENTFISSYLRDIKREGGDGQFTISSVVAAGTCVRP